ncbi:9425_t:CDS:1, partial [Dentiscutata heterogama]
SFHDGFPKCFVNVFGLSYSEVTWHASGLFNVECYQNEIEVEMCE